VTKRRRPALHSRPGGAGLAGYYLLMELPKLKTSISSSMKRMIIADMFGSKDGIEGNKAPTPLRT
jgi:hypothetical protein